MIIVIVSKGKHLNNSADELKVRIFEMECDAAEYCRKINNDSRNKGKWWRMAEIVKEEEWFSTPARFEKYLNQYPDTK